MEITQVEASPRDRNKVLTARKGVSLCSSCVNSVAVSVTLMVNRPLHNSSTHNVLLVIHIESTDRVSHRATRAQHVLKIGLDAPALPRAIRSTRTEVGKKIPKPCCDTPSVGVGMDYEKWGLLWR